MAPKDAGLPRGAPGPRSCSALRRDVRKTPRDPTHPTGGPEGLTLKGVSLNTAEGSVFLGWGTLKGSTLHDYR